MIEHVAVSVSLTPELHGFAKELVRGGGYGSTSEVVRAGLRLLQRQEAGARPAAPHGWPRQGQTQPVPPQSEDR